MGCYGHPDTTALGKHKSCKNSDKRAHFCIYLLDGVCLETLSFQKWNAAFLWHFIRLLLTVAMRETEYIFIKPQFNKESARLQHCRKSVLPPDQSITEKQLRQKGMMRAAHWAGATRCIYPAARQHIDAHNERQLNVHSPDLGRRRRRVKESNYSKEKRVCCLCASPVWHFSWAWCQSNGVNGDKASTDVSVHH